VWRDYWQTFDATFSKAGENSMTLSVPGDCTSGVCSHYLRLELAEK